MLKCNCTSFIFSWISVFPTSITNMLLLVQGTRASNVTQKVPKENHVVLQSQTVNHLEEIRKICFKGNIWWSGCYLLPAKSLQSCPTLCDPIDGSPPGSPVPGILQARTLERVAISFSNAWKWKVKVKSLSRFWLFTTPWTAAHQAPPSMGFSRQEYWSGVPLPSPEWWSGGLVKEVTAPHPN